MDRLSFSPSTPIHVGVVDCYHSPNGVRIPLVDHSLFPRYQFYRIMWLIVVYYNRRGPPNVILSWFS